MTLKELEKALKSGIATVYVVIGKSYLVRQAVSRIVPAALEGGIADFNHDRYRAGQDDLHPASAQARTMPMMARRRVIEVAECESLKPDELDRLGEVAAKGIDTSCLVIHGEKIDQRSRLAKEAKKQGTLLDFAKLTEGQITAWIEKTAADRGKSIAPDAVRALTQAWGESLEKMEAEIEKATLYVGEEKDRIELDDLLEVMVAVKAERIFDLTDAVGARQRAKALYFLAGMLENGNHPIRVHSSLTTHLKKLLRANAMRDAGLSHDDVIRGVGGHPYAAKKAVEQARRYRTEELRRAVELCSKVDFELKNGRVNDRMLLEELVLELCAQENPTSMGTPGRV
ncbi:MAG: DNA polymerase III subunit delta [Deltaproteobacteria bacterium]|nr:DNA polymerase III subunit delta [Deltaproteobacteria bacterium]MCB9479520.1 DNA polymerase III subunit delta [Deltaproteobacteria bacterium]MCB9488450.1 DNA polymerase III subunit delta [Deltaproteobacteria bacterium]